MSSIIDILKAAATVIGAVAGAVRAYIEYRRWLKQEGDESEKEDGEEKREAEINT